MKAAIYVRSSNNSPDREMQLKVCLEYAERHGYPIFAEYIENTEYDGGRESLFRLMKDSGKKQFQGVLVYSYDRLTRDASNFDAYRVALKENGVELISVTESPLMDSNALLVKRLHEAYAEYYRAEHSAKVKEGIRRAKERKAALAAATNEAD